MSEEIPQCPHCGSLHIQYYAQGESWHDVLHVFDKTVLIGKTQGEDITESKFVCLDCDQEVPYLDELEKDFAF